MHSGDSWLTTWLTLLKKLQMLWNQKTHDYVKNTYHTGSNSEPDKSSLENHIFSKIHPLYDMVSKKELQLFLISS